MTERSWKRNQFRGPTKILTSDNSQLCASSLVNKAFIASNGEYGWTHEQLPEVVDQLVRSGRVILGGELWWVLPGASSWTGFIPPRDGRSYIFHWTTERRKPHETWDAFMGRAADEALRAVQALCPSQVSSQRIYQGSYSIT
jgi:hypothetical protein